MEVITEKEQQQEILCIFHSAVGENLQIQLMGSHLGQNKTRERIAKSCYWL